MSSFSKQSEEEEEETGLLGHYSLDPLLYDPVSDLRKYSEPRTPESTCENYDIPINKIATRCTPVHKPIEMPKFPYTVQSPHKDHRIMDPEKVLREFGASQILSHPSSAELPPGILAKPMRKEENVKNQWLEESVRKTPVRFKIELPQNFVPTKKEMDELRKSFLSSASTRESKDQVDLSTVVPKCVVDMDNITKPIEGFNPGRSRNMTTWSNQQLLYHNQHRVQRHNITNRFQESIRSVAHTKANRYGESFTLLGNSVSAQGYSHHEENRNHMHNPHYSYPLHMENTTATPDMTSCSVDINAVPWHCTAGWTPQCTQPTYQLSQSYNGESMSYALEPGFYGEHSLASTGSYPSVAYLQKLWGVHSGDTQMPYAPNPSSSYMAAFWRNPGSHRQMKEQTHRQDYPYYNTASKGF